MTIIPKAMYRFNEILIKMLMIFLTEIETNPMIHMEPQKTQDSHINPQRKKRTMMERLPVETSRDIKEL